MGGVCVNRTKDTYSEEFFRRIYEESKRSADILVPILFEKFAPTSVLDVGCGAGHFLRKFFECGVTDFLGLDGGDLLNSELQVPIGKMLNTNLEHGFNLGRTFDLSLCLEVAEHLPEESAKTLIQSLVAHSNTVIFSAAFPGQGGTAHLNERYPSYWHNIFSEFGYKACDIFRGVLWENDEIGWFYRQNIFVYIAENCAAHVLSNPSDKSVNFGGLPVVHPHIFEYKNRLISELMDALSALGINAVNENGVTSGLSFRERIYTPGDWELLSRDLKYCVQNTEPRVRQLPSDQGELGCLPNEGDSLRSPLRVCIVTPDIAGPINNGGIGTAYASLAEQLANDGNEVTIFYTLAGHSETKDVAYWKRRYLEKGITFVPRPEHKGSVLEASWYTSRAYEVFEWMLEYEDKFDVVHFPEWGGLLYYTLLAKRQGLAFRKTLFCVGTHSPSLWHHLNDGKLIDRLDLLELDFLERKCVELSDVLVSPSQYMVSWLRDHGWALPSKAYVQHNVVRTEIGAKGLTDEMRQSLKGEAITEIVFFGRLEQRKGLLIFCDAVERFLKKNPNSIKITFLGKSSVIKGMDSIQYIRERTSEWATSVSVLNELDSIGALSYLAMRGRVAVIASLVENSPYTVVECLLHRIPFLTSDVGGIKELIDEKYVGSITFTPTAKGLEAKLTELVGAGIVVAEPRIAFGENNLRWKLWHDRIPRQCSQAEKDPMVATNGPLVSVCLTHFNRPILLEEAIESIRKQTYQNIEVVLVDDGSTQPSAIARLRRLEEEFNNRGWKIIYQENSYLGAARNTAAFAASGEYLLFMDDDNVAMPEEIETFVRAALNTGADVLTCPMAVFSEDQSPGNSASDVQRMWIPLGGATAVGVFRNCFGDANALVRADTFRDMGGFTEDYGLGHEDWEFFAKCALADRKIEVVPFPLFWYRSKVDSMIRTTDFGNNHLRSIRPYLEIVRDEVGMALLLAEGYHYGPVRQSAPAGKAVVYGIPENMQGAPLKDIANALLDSRSMRMTRPLRAMVSFVKGKRYVALEKMRPRDNEEAMRMIGTIIQSNSWGITSPLRAFVRVFRRQ